MVSLISMNIFGIIQIKLILITENNFEQICNFRWIFVSWMWFFMDSCWKERDDFNMLSKWYTIKCFSAIRWKTFHQAYSLGQWFRFSFRSYLQHRYRNVSGIIWQQKSEFCLTSLICEFDSRMMLKQSIHKWKHCFLYIFI